MIIYILPKQPPDSILNGIVVFQKAKAMSNHPCSCECATIEGRIGSEGKSNSIGNYMEI